MKHLDPVVTQSGDYQSDTLPGNHSAQCGLVASWRFNADDLRLRPQQTARGRSHANVGADIQDTSDWSLQELETVYVVQEDFFVNEVAGTFGHGQMWFIKLKHVVFQSITKMFNPRALNAFRPGAGPSPGL
jgi:hypothetical protein